MRLYKSKLIEMKKAYITTHINELEFILKSIS